jgi:SPP1 family predicted phage head-tail adaptor
MLEPTAADLKQRVRFDRRATTSDGYGNTVGSWAEVTTRAAKLTPTRGREEIIADRLQGTAAYDCWVRKDSVTDGITTDDRVVDVRNTSRTFNIVFKGDMTGNGQWLLFQLTLGDADG